MKSKIMQGGLLVAISLSPCTALAQGAVSSEWRWLTIVVFGAIIALTLLVTFIAAKRVSSASDYYAAGSGISGLQNGWAIAGDYLSAASFLGIAGLIALYGFDGFLYSVGFLVAFVTVLLVIAEPCRNIGKYTLSDILAFRNNPRTARVMGSLSIITVSIFYLTAQMVGGGLLVELIVGIDYTVSVIAVGVLMLVYVLFGGMLATTWVQIIKAVLLVIAAILLTILAWAPYGFSLPGLLDAVISDQKVLAQVVKLLGGAGNMNEAELGQLFLEPGLFLTRPLDLISLGLGLVLGTAGLPHILMRFFTVPDAKQARKSVVWAMAIIGGFYVITLILGMSAAINVGALDIATFDEGGNMAAPLLAQHLGGGPDALLGNLLLAFVAAVAFATIVAIVAGLVLACSAAIAHDLYVNVFRGGHAEPAEQVRAARVATLIVGAIAITIGILAEGQNVAHLVGLAFAVAASANLPCLLLTLYWRRCNTGGIVAGILVGTLSAVALVMVSPNMTYPLIETADAQAVVDAGPATIKEIRADMAAAKSPGERKSLESQIAAVKDQVAAAKADVKTYEGQTESMLGLRAPLFPLENPGIVSIPLGFLAVFLGSLLWRDRRAEEMWEETYVRQQTGILSSAGAAH
ncbi:MAG: cation/acetate symporter ActP [Gammaproteobacteria bacterium]|nr:cation/acetate symporter ActP [Gammaproteobacteria bacterium]